MEKEERLLNKEKCLEKADQLICSLYTKLNKKEINFILEKDSIKEEDKGIKLTIIEPITEFMSIGKKEKNKRRELLITKAGNVEVLKNTIEDKKEETLNEFINRTTYSIEPCKEDLFRMMKEKTSLTFEIDDNSIKRLRITTPYVYYLNDKGQILDIIPLNRKVTENTNDRTKSR